MVTRILQQAEKIAFRDWIYYSLLALFAISLPSSITACTVLQVLFAVHWLSTGNFREKINRFWANKPVVMLSSVFLVYLTAILWTDDLENGMVKELLNKLPILTLPFFIASEKPVHKGLVKMLPILFSLSVFVVSIIGTIMFLSNDLLDSRQLSPFINHIHFGNMVVLSIFWLPMAVKRSGINRFWFYFSLGISAWLLFFIFYMATLTAWLGLSLILLYFGIKWLRVGKFDYLKKIVISVSFLGVILLIALFFHFYKPLFLQKEYPVNENARLTVLGNPYHHDKGRMDRENGYLVFSYLADRELQEAWNKRSNIPFDSLDHSQNEIRYTSYRFLTSKGLTKDSAGLAKISENEIQGIENGVPNYLYLKWPSIMVRIHQSLWELQRYYLSGDPRGHTMAQRLELWKAGWVAFLEEPLFGWGTGDLPEAMEFGLEKIDSKMETFMKPHNQLLYLLLMTGLIGTLIVLILLAIYIVRSRAYQNLGMKIALILFGVTMFSHTILDYQMSMSLFLFCLLYFGEINKTNPGNE